MFQYFNILRLDGDGPLAVTVNLATGKATGVTGTVSNIQGNPTRGEC